MAETLLNGITVGSYVHNSLRNCCGQVKAIDNTRVCGNVQVQPLVKGKAEGEPFWAQGSDIILLDHLVYENEMDRLLDAMKDLQAAYKLVTDMHKADGR